jgi:hypothetical protein
MFSHDMNKLWYDEFPPGTPWTVLWHGYIVCGCGGIRECETNCPVCGKPFVCSYITFQEGGITHTLPAAQMGAESRIEDYFYLYLMQEEWMRDESNTMKSVNSMKHLSSKTSIVLYFWTYFETKIERLLRRGLKGTPAALIEDTLDRYSSIGSRIDRLYKVIFNTTYMKDLQDIGYGNLADHIKRVQRQRNEFMHGNPSAINDDLILAVVSNLKDEHEAWIQLFNKYVKGSFD